MRIQVFFEPSLAQFVAQFRAGWNQVFPADQLEIQEVSLEGSPACPTPQTLPSRLTVHRPRHLDISAQAELLLVLASQVDDQPATANLVNLVVSRAFRAQVLAPVVALVQDTPLSRRQLSDSGLSGVYLRSQHPRRSATDWGRIMAQTWHI